MNSEEYGGFKNENEKKKAIVPLLNVDLDHVSELIVEKYNTSKTSCSKINKKTIHNINRVKDFIIYYIPFFR